MAGCSEVTDALGGMFRRQTVDALQFDNHTTIHEQIHDVISDTFAFVVNIDTVLRLGIEPSQYQLMVQCSFINLFKKTRPKNIGNFIDRSDDLCPSVFICG